MPRNFFDVKDGHRLFDASGFVCEDDTDAIIRATVLTIGVSLDTLSLLAQLSYLLCKAFFKGCRLSLRDVDCLKLRRFGMRCSIHSKLAGARLVFSSPMKATYRAVMTKCAPRSREAPESKS
jgi:hypothetical protein